MDYIKLNRKIMEWEWYPDINTSRLFIHMLLKANWKEGRFQGCSVPRGSFVSSIKKLSQETALTEREIRTAVSHLKSTGELTSRTTNRFTVFTVVNYDLYQSDDRQNDIQPTGRRHSNDILTTTIEERKKERRKENNKNIMCAADADALFESLWKLYPEKKGKGQVPDAAKRRLLKTGFDEMSRAIDRYKAELEKDKNWRKPQNGSTFFNSGYADYLDENYVPGRKQEGRGKGNSFNSYEQREYNYEELERELAEMPDEKGGRE